MRNDDLLVAVLGITASTIVIVGMITAMYRVRARRLKVLEQALQNASLAPQVQERLVAELTKPGLLGRVFGGGRLLLVAGWIGMFIGISILVSGQHDAEEVGIPFALMSFAVLTVPFALRELDHKRPAASRRT